MDKETQKDTRQRMQKKDNAPFNNQPIRTKRKEDKKKVTFHQENCLPKSAFKRTRKQQNCPSASKEQEATNSPKYLQKNRKQQNPHIRSSPSILSRLVGSAGPMSPPAKKVLLWIGSPGGMAAANMATRLAATT
jgi:hypothetical protein